LYEFLLKTIFLLSVGMMDWMDAVSKELFFLA